MMESEPEVHWISSRRGVTCKYCNKKVVGCGSHLQKHVDTVHHDENAKDHERASEPRGEADEVDVNLARDLLTSLPAQNRHYGGIFTNGPLVNPDISQAGMPDVFDTNGKLRDQYQWIDPKSTQPPTLATHTSETHNSAEVDATQTEDLDLAFNRDLWAYQTGITNREKRLVIRVRNDGNDSPGVSKLRMDMDIIEHTGAGKKWSLEERDVSGTDMANIVVVIGEFLPVFAILRDWESPTAEDGWAFNPTKHTIVPQFEDAVIVVRRLSDKKQTFHYLHGKRDGLCRISQLPQGCEDRIVYYDEWTQTGPVAHPTVRNNMWENNISNFCQNYIEERQKGSVADIATSASNSSGTLTTKFDRFKSLSTFVMECWASYRWVSFHVPGHPKPRCLMDVHNTLEVVLPTLRNKRQDPYKSLAPYMRDVREAAVKLNQVVDQAMPKEEAEDAFEEAVWGMWGHRVHLENASYTESL